MAKIPQKINKNACILVHDIRRIDLIKIEITQSVLKFLHEMLGIDFKSHLIVGADFW